MSQIDAMHREYGRRHFGQCKDCPHFYRHQWQRTYLKCAAYGASNCTATDWRASWPACKLFDQPDISHLVPLKEYLEPRRAPEEPLEGQVTWE